jgi:hypothetical protein
MAEAKSYQEPTKTNKPDLVIEACHLSYMRDMGRRITV